MALNIKEFKAKVIEIRIETPIVKTFKLGLDKEIEFNAGQFVMLSKEGVKITRPYSIASSPNNKDFIEVTLDRKEEGYFSKILHDEIKLGDELKMKGPYGVFYYKEYMGKNLLLIGAGTGIAPLRSIINYIIDNNLDINATLLYSVKTPDDIIFKKELMKLKNKINCIFTVTRHDKSDWTGLKGRINEDILKDKINNELFYICGPPTMVIDMEFMLKKLGVKNDKIRTERWD